MTQRYQGMAKLFFASASESSKVYSIFWQVFHQKD